MSGTRRSKLQNRREELGLSQKNVAERARISRAYYTNIERGVKDPSLKVAQRISNALNSDMSLFESDVSKGNKKVHVVSNTCATA
ncbi:helix-turn-helix transcriptional regulator [Alicyclobacillus fastidiosus]|uniref:Helix-turn-helix transcriptional regulator n=1 Tax=Alicyclobacillus fastidiosus TaxID=392011 RepID=A0ABY6ZKY9_9BACL|nr:helix-turn-helix transcriptional regulator [Alicyclobacillus fastidiosus]WAH43527.1 helix-turn-helix transcriptional regulator [Alicyclobacillus fastidiosus]GMA59694.1 hypothetical protein GCM10025859_01340 [Alicyclobacillus fastidiosus]GMA65544.1 hypothetical protein GCM10025859_59840 [Alicyclobacillus fastidiosus]